MRDALHARAQGPHRDRARGFPDGTTGAQLDPFARALLWEAGLDYDHGTGHGVGSYLSVHEGPARISKLGTAPLKRGMILSNEPGYYKAGAYGIRIENLVLVVEAPAAPGGEKSLNSALLTLISLNSSSVTLHICKGAKRVKRVGRETLAELIP